MNSHVPFDADNDWTLDPYHCNRSNDPLVDKLIGNAYHVVRTVYCNLGNLKLIFDFLNQYGMVLGVQSEAELKAMTTSASYVRLYGFDNTNKRVVTDYLYVDGDRTGVIPDDPTATGSWILVATSNSGGGGGEDDGKASPPYIPYTYNNGSAIGGETTIVVPAGTVGVPMIVVEGYTNLVGYGFSYDATSLTVTLTQPLEPGDEVHLFLTGTPAVPDNPNVTDWVQINWLYNGGYAVGGEQVIAIPYTFESVPAIYKNGERYYAGLADKSYTVDAANQRILLTEPLATNDRLIVTIGGESTTLVMSDRTVQEVARSANVKDSEVILSSNTTQYLNGMKVVYDVVDQKIYGLPALPANVYINSVSNGQLTYSPGNITVTLLAPYQQQNIRELWRRSLAEAGLTLVDGSFEEGATVNSKTDVVWHVSGGQCYAWYGALPHDIVAGTNPVGVVDWVLQTDPTLRGDLGASDGALLIGNFESSAGVISAKLHGVQSGVDCAPIIQQLQDLSEQLRVPIDFSGIDVVAFSGRVQIGDWFHWKGAGRYKTRVKPLSLTQAEVGQNGWGTWGWFTRKNPDTNLNFFMCEDMTFDGQYQDGYEINTIAPTKMIMMFGLQANNSTCRDITFLRCHFKNCPHEGIDIYTSNGGQFDGVRMLFCSSEGTDPSLTSVGFNLFNLRNGRVSAPGPYGTYTIRNVVSFGNVSKGHRTQNNFCRGTEMWSISSCQTYDMNDCHHSTDGSRRGSARDLVGVQTGASYRTKNFFELQGEEIDVDDCKYTAAPVGTAGQAGIFVTDWKYDSETSAPYNQSKHVNVRNFYAERVNAAAVRLINNFGSTVENIEAVSCNGVGVSFEYVSGRNLTPSFNKVGKVTTQGCPGEISVSTINEVIMTENGQNNGGGYRIGTGDSVFVDSPLPFRSVCGYHLVNQDRTLKSVTSTGPDKTDAASKPVQVPYAFTLDDTNTDSVQSLSVGVVPVNTRSAVYLKIWALAGSASSSAAIFREKNSAGTTLSTTPIRLFADTTWKERLAVYHVKNATCIAVEVLLAPACDSSLTTTLTGTTSFADVRISDLPL